MSADRQPVQSKFVEKYGLSFPMIPDPGKSIIASYGAKAVLGVTARRSTFLVDPEGRVAHVWPDVDVNGHADDVVATIRRLSNRQ